MFIRSLIVALVGSAAAVTSAIPLAPGDHVGPLNDTEISDRTLPSGTVVAHESRSITAMYDDPNSFSDGLPTRDGTFESWVLRQNSGHLSFVYSFEFPGADAGNFQIGDEETKLSVDSFTGFSTDVLGTTDKDHGSSTEFARSSDGSTINLSTGDGQGYLPFAIVNTNATHFQHTGNATADFFDFFAAPHDPNADGGEDLFQATVNVGNTFAPAQSTTAVPLPPAAYGGLAMLAGIVATRIRRPNV